MSNAEHTATPWRNPPQTDWRHHGAVIMAGDDPNTTIRVGVCYDNHVTRQVAEANAAFIVLAANNHAALVNALDILTRAANISDPDPLIMFAAIEKARHALEGVGK